MRDTGTIPTEIGLLSSLEKLYLNQNQLTGGVPSEIGLLLQLKFITLHNTALEGTMPEEVCDLETNGNLQRIFISKNMNISCACCILDNSIL